MGMGRKPTRNSNLPRGMRARHRPSGTYYYVEVWKDGVRKEVPVGSDYTEAIRKWGELTEAPTIGERITFRKVAERYVREVLPKKEPRTREDNLDELAMLYQFFDKPPVALDAIKPVHIRQYLDWRVESTIERMKAKNVTRVKAGRDALPVPPNAGHVRANREKALFSHIWNFARNKGLTEKENPCRGIEGHEETGRDVYVEDEVYELVRGCAEDWLADLITLAYLLGQRPADSRKVTRADIKEGAVWVKQNKTKAKLRVFVEGELKEVLDRIDARNKAAKVATIGPDAKLFPKTEYEYRGAFDRARDAAVEKRPDLAAQIREYQFRDLRAKALTDKEEREGMRAAQDLSGHTTEAMTRHYVRNRKGKLVTPTK